MNIIILSEINKTLVIINVERNAIIIRVRNDNVTNLLIIIKNL